MGHYQQISMSAGEMRTLVLRKQAGHSPPHASNTTGPKPSPFGPNPSTLKMCLDCHCPSLNSHHPLTRLVFLFLVSFVYSTQSHQLASFLKNRSDYIIPGKKEGGKVGKEERKTKLRDSITS